MPDTGQHSHTADLAEHVVTAVDNIVVVCVVITHDCTSAHSTSPLALPNTSYTPGTLISPHISSVPPSMLLSKSLGGLMHWWLCSSDSTNSLVPQVTSYRHVVPDIDIIKGCSLAVSNPKSNSVAGYLAIGVFFPDWVDPSVVNQYGLHLGPIIRAYLTLTVVAIATLSR